MYLAHKITLHPNNKQATYFARACGVARFSYNWGLQEWQEQYRKHQADPTLPKPTETALRRQLNSIKGQLFPWMAEVTKNAPQMALIQLGTSFKNFFAGRAAYPKPRRKGIDDRFSLTNDQFKLQGKMVRIPHLGWVRMRESLRFRGKIMSATVSRTAGTWFISIAVELDDLSHLPKAENQGPVGVDLGIKALATLSTGEIVIGSQALRRHLIRLRRLSRSLSRKKKGSRNRCHARQRLARLHARLSNKRKDTLHKLTSDLTRRFSVIGIEDLNIKGMLRNRRLSRAIADAGFFEWRRQLEYKAQLRGNLVVIASPWFASSKTCSTCGAKLDVLELGERTWDCPSCNAHHDRDLNAAINLMNMAVSSTVTACGEEGAGQGHLVLVKPASVKQEGNAKLA